MSLALKNGLILNIIGSDIVLTQTTTDNATDTTTNATVSEPEVIDATPIEGEVMDSASTEGGAQEGEATDSASTEGETQEGEATDSAPLEGEVQEGEAMDVAPIEGEEIGMEGDMSTGMDFGMMPGMEGGQEVKDPLLSNWVFIGGISAASLVVGVIIGILLAKKKIKKGIDLYEN